MSMVSVCLPSDALLQQVPSYLGFSYLGRGVSLHGCSSKVQPLLLTLDKGYLLTIALPDLQLGKAPLGPPAPAQPLLLGRGLLFPAATPAMALAITYIYLSLHLSSVSSLQLISCSCDLRFYNHNPLDKVFSTG